MLAMQQEIQTKKDDEAAQAEALEKEAMLRLQMEKEIEMEKIKAAKEETERLERIRKEEAQIKARQEAFTALEKKLSHALPLVQEANLIAIELKRKMTFNSKMIRVMSEFAAAQDTSRTDIVIRVDNGEDNYYYIWDVEKL